MATENAVLMKNARASLEGNWGLAIGTYVVYFLVIAATQALPPALLILAGPLGLGAVTFALKVSRGGEPKLEQIFDGFQNFSNAMVAYLLVILYVFLWTLLLIIPGIIAALGYSMVLFIMHDEPNIKPSEALEKSKAMMYGYKAKLFRMYLRFFGWSLLCLLTFGIGYLFLVPYMYTSYAKFYDDVKAEYDGNNQSKASNYTPPVPPMGKTDAPADPIEPSNVSPDESSKRGYDYEK